MDFSISELNYNSVETIPGFEARAAFTVNSGAVFREDADIIPTIVDENLSFMPWGGDNLMPFNIIDLQFVKFLLGHNFCSCCWCNFTSAKLQPGNNC